ncbi:MAG: hypothetical protein M4D80_37685 [Myxococcota bacterium]|nr:hypothetical protein [Deltaproteobacteria bacterium]MDQ3340925.1 hypothetical protein [Myxococcota bacterium]
MSKRASAELRYVGKVTAVVSVVLFALQSLEPPRQAHGGAQYYIRTMRRFRVLMSEQVQAAQSSPYEPVRQLQCSVAEALHHWTDYLTICHHERQTNRRIRHVAGAVSPTGRIALDVPTMTGEQPHGTSVTSSMYAPDNYAAPEPIRCPAPISTPR